MAADTEVRGTAWLAEYVNDQLGTEVDGYKVRILLRQLAKDGVIEREEGRYNFTGPKDPQVVAVLKAVRSGGVEKASNARLDELKQKRTAKKGTAKAKAAPVEEDEEEAPAPRTRTRKSAAAKKAAAAEAAPAKRSRRKPAPVEDDEDLDIDEI
jgi:hypothetical protein